MYVRERFLRPVRARLDIFARDEATILPLLVFDRPLALVWDRRGAPGHDRTLASSSTTLEALL